MERMTLERMAVQIEMVLARNESPARVSGGVVTPRQRGAPGLARRTEKVEPIER